MARLLKHPSFLHRVGPILICSDRLNVRIIQSRATHEAGWPGWMEAFWSHEQGGFYSAVNFLCALVIWPDKRLERVPIHLEPHPDPRLAVVWF